MDKKQSKILLGQLQAAIKATAKIHAEGYGACCRAVPLLTTEGGLVSKAEAEAYLDQLLSSLAPKPIPDHVREKMIAAGKDIPADPLDKIIVMLFCAYQEPNNPKDQGVLVRHASPPTLVDASLRILETLNIGRAPTIGHAPPVGCENPTTKQDELTFQAIQACRALELLPPDDDGDAPQRPARRSVTFASTALVANGDCNFVVTHESIRQAAYFLWVNDGRLPDRDLHYWFMAKRHLGPQPT